MKKIIIMVVFSLMAAPAFSQFIFAEQDCRFPSGQKAIPLNKFQWDQKVKGNVSMGPFLLTTPGWYEATWYINYTKGPLVFGWGNGVEQLNDKWSYRTSPWFQYNHAFKKDTTKSIFVFVLWEFGNDNGYNVSKLGNGYDNYWYMHNISYESTKLSAGITVRRYYGVGPIIGRKFKADGWNVKLSGAGLYDFEENIPKLAVMLTITN